MFMSETVRSYFLHLKGFDRQYFEAEVSLDISLSSRYITPFRSKMVGGIKTHISFRGKIGISTNISLYQPIFKIMCAILKKGLIFSRSTMSYSAHNSSSGGKQSSLLGKKKTT